MKIKNVHKEKILSCPILVTVLLIVHHNSFKCQGKISKIIIFLTFFKIQIY